MTQSNTHFYARFYTNKSNESYYGFDQNGGNLRANVVNSSGTTSYICNAVTVGSWFNIAMDSTQDGVRFYVNGTLCAEQDVAHALEFITMLNGNINGAWYMDEFWISNNERFRYITNTTLISLSAGTHNITIYANDSSGNMGNSSLVNFSISLEVDSCTYTSGDWNVNCGDNCTINNEVNVNKNKLILDETGVFSIEADIINVKNITFEGSCEIIKGAGNITMVKN